MSDAPLEISIVLLIGYVPGASVTTSPGPAASIASCIADVTLVASPDGDKVVAVAVAAAKAVNASAENTVVFIGISFFTVATVK